MSQDILVVLTLSLYKNMNKFFTVQEAITVYKGDKKLEQETDAIGAVGLGASNLFQSFVVCSEYTKDNTRLSFSKISSGLSKLSCCLKKITGETPEVRTDKIFNLIDIFHLRFDI